MTSHTPIGYNEGTMTPEYLDSLQEQIEEYLPTSLQVKLNEVFDSLKSKPKEVNPLDGIIIEHVKRNNHGEILFSGFTISKEAEDLLFSIWNKQWGKGIESFKQNFKALN